eukprot:COSAG01_NODE_8548_length_2746_cov_3.096713_4_plen_46_part_00
MSGDTDLGKAALLLGWVWRDVVSDLVVGEDAQAGSACWTHASLLD